MNETHLLVNGVERELPENDGLFGGLISRLRAAYSSDQSCISSIRLDGQEISENEESAFQFLPLSDLRSIEIFTAHPREMAEETLRSLIGFAEHLTAMSCAVGSLFKDNAHPSRQLAKLVDGIQTFTEALSSVKQILRAPSVGPVRMLEADLTSIMRDLLEAYSQSEYTYVAELLSEHLPRNLADWRGLGIPALTRSRDS